MYIGDTTVVVWKSKRRCYFWAWNTIKSFIYRWFIRNRGTCQVACNFIEPDWNPDCQRCHKSWTSQYRHGSGTLCIISGASWPSSRVVTSFVQMQLPLTSGAIIPLKGLFYKPRYQTYVLRVAAMDLGYPNRKTTDRVHVHMHKQTFNDHRPEFRSRTVFTVNEEVPLGTLVGTVKAVDLDVGPGEGLTLEIVNQRPGQYAWSAWVIADNPSLPSTETEMKPFRRNFHH